MWSMRLKRPMKQHKWHISVLSYACFFFCKFNHQVFPYASHLPPQWEIAAVDLFINKLHLIRANSFGNLSRLCESAYVRLALLFLVFFFPHSVASWRKKTWDILCASEQVESLWHFSNEVWEIWEHAVCEISVYLWICLSGKSGHRTLAGR